MQHFLFFYEGVNRRRIGEVFRQNYDTIQIYTWYGIYDILLVFTYFVLKLFVRIRSCK